ncbi:MAG: YkgJ family cysteine cluster protein [Armatimonadota bacterium]
MTEADADRLRDIYAALPNEDCEGCDGCGSKCAGAIPMTRWEFEQVRAYLSAQPQPEDADDRTRRQAARAAGDASPFSPPCEFRDAERRRCRIYPVRPLICRLFGLVEWLPCPLGRWDVRVPDGWDIIAWYGRLQRRSYREWLQASPADSLPVAADFRTGGGGADACGRSGR